MEIRTERENRHLPELPDRVTMYPDEADGNGGSVTIRVPNIDGSSIFLRAGTEEFGNFACMTVQEALDFYGKLGTAIQQAMNLRKRFGVEHDER